MPIAIVQSQLITAHCGATRVKNSGRVDVMLITSTRPEFFTRVAPQWAVISCGLHNRYGHPREEVLEELQNARVKTFRTDINGASCFVLDGKRAEADLCGQSQTIP